MKAESELKQVLDRMKAMGNPSKNERKNVEYLEALLGRDKRTLRRIHREIREEEEVQSYIEN